MATTLAKLYPRIDKICDAAFIKKAVGTTKKDSVVFFLTILNVGLFLRIKKVISIVLMISYAMILWTFCAVKTCN